MPQNALAAPPLAATRGRWIRPALFWAFTAIIASEMVAGSFWDLLRVEYVRVIISHLGYPLYVLPILGLCKLPGALVILAPGFPRLKEWAYAGCAVNYYGATASHLAVGDGPARWAGPLVFLGFTLASWALRPAARRLPAASEAASRREWMACALLAAALIAFALATLPKGPPPGY